jgi:hypothetical protein
MEDARIEPRTAATSALIVRRTKTRLDLIHNFLLLRWDKPYLCWPGLAGELDSNPRVATQLLETLPVP